MLLLCWLVGLGMMRTPKAINALLERSRDNNLSTTHQYISSSDGNIKSEAIQMTEQIVRQLASRPCMQQAHPRQCIESSTQFGFRFRFILP